MQNREMKERILEYIVGFVDANGFAPTYREIGSAVGLRSSSSVSRHIEQLKAEGRITLRDQKSRTLAPLRRLELVKASEERQRRVQLEVADGGVICFDCNLEKTGTDGVSITFSGVLDASQLKGTVGRVVSCRLETNEQGEG
jgi:SOS-response transcriptional repressor LexA